MSDIVYIHNNTSPSFPVHNKDNVNAQLYRAQSLLAMWDFLEYKGRIGRTHVVLNKMDGPSRAKFVIAFPG